MGYESDIALLGFRQLASGDFGGTLTHAGLALPAVIGTFAIQQVLNADGGGFSPMLMCNATVAREDLPATFTAFKRGESVAVAPGDSTRPPRACQVYDMTDCGALIELTLNDRNQGA